MADEIHALNKNEIQDIDYDTYFGEMDLSDEEKEDRKKLAEKFEKIFVMLFLSLIHILRAHETGRNLVCRLLLEKKKK